MSDALSSNPVSVFNLEDKTDNRIVNNLECGYHLKNTPTGSKKKPRAKAWTAIAQGGDG
jgi:hypothetical protein